MIHLPLDDSFTHTHIYNIIDAFLTDFSYQAGAAGLLLHASLLSIAVAVYWSGSLSQKTPILFFLCLIVS